MIGLLGGAFDPPHIGHVALADAAEQELDLEQVVVVVVADPGHKDVHAPAETRLELARLAFPGREVMLDHHARTADMLRDGPWDDPVFLIGADEYLDFQSWKEPEAVLALARLGVATRPGFDLPSLPPERVLFFEIEPVPVSSREVRALAARGEPIDGLVPPAVAAAIGGLGLYRG
jgi:nicotinate-nucleotide adenylyltransferase